MNLFTYGWINPVLAFVMSTLGCLLAIVLAIKARGRARRGRGRLLVYATVALGGIGVFQADLLALLGFGTGGAVVRYHSWTLLTGLGVAIVTVGAALSLVCFGQPGTLRLAAAGSLIGAGTAATHYVAVTGMRGAGYLYYEPIRFVGSVAIAMLAGCATLWFVLSLRRLRAAVLAASVAGASICGMHYTALSGLRTQPGLLVAVDGSQPVLGPPPVVLMGPAVLLGAAVTAMLWFFTVGASTVHDLRAIFEHPENSVEIEPWMIAEVTRRVGVGYRPSLASLAAAGPSRAAPSRLPAHLNRYPPGYRPALPSREGTPPQRVTGQP